MRLDKALIEQGFFPTRAKAQDAIAAGLVTVNGVIVTKNSYDMSESSCIEVKQAPLQFVSRAGFKLYDVLEPFAIDLKDRIVMDVGASTGGFSDVCLQQGARYVYEMDVGYGQMDSSLLQNERLCNMEHINCRYLQKDMFDLPIDFACVDVSFISLKLILPAMIACMEHIEIVALIKPQFESGKQHCNKNGIVKDKKVHIRILQELHEFIRSLGCDVHHMRKSSMIGRDGNQEYVFHIRKAPCMHVFDYHQIYHENIEQR